MSDDFNDFGTEHEITDEPNVNDNRRQASEFRGKNLLELDEKEAAKRMRREFDDSHKRVKRFIEQWKVNQARSQGFTGVKLIKEQDNARFFVPLGATPSVTSMNKAIRLKRRLRATIFADPPGPHVQPASDDDDDRDSAQFSTRALEVLSSPNKTRYTLRCAQAWDLGSDYGSGFIHIFVDPHGGGRKRRTAQVRGVIPAVEGVSEAFDAPQTLEEGLVDPRNGLDWEGPTVEMFVTEDGFLTEDPEEAELVWLPSLDLELLTGKNVRFHPYTALDIWNADGVSVGMMIPLGELRRKFPEAIEDLSDEELGELVRARPKNWKDLLRIGEKDYAGTEKIRDESLVFTLFRYQRQSAQYEEGAYLVMAGNDKMLQRETWYDEFNDDPLDIPITQIKQYDDEDNPYGKGCMEFMGPANEIRASVLGTFLEWLDKFRTRKTFVPVTSTLQAKQLQSPTKTVLPITPGQQPFFEDVPELPSIVKEMFAFTTADLDDESGLQDSGQALPPANVNSDRQLQTILSQIRVGLSQLKQNAEAGITRGWSIMLQLARAFFEEQQKLAWIGEDGEHKEKSWNGSDLSDSTDVIMAQGSFTLMDPEMKVQFAYQLMSVGLLDQQTALRSISGNVSPLLALGEDRHRQRVARQIHQWQQGPPKAWTEKRTQVLASHQAQIQEQMNQLLTQVTDPAQLEDPALQQQLNQIASQPPPPDEVLATIFAPLPIDEEPLVAAVRAHELGRAISAASYWKWPAEWQDGIVSEYLKARQAAGIVTIAEQQAAQQQAVEQQSTLEAQQQQADLQEAQIKADAEIQKVQITQQGSVQKELLKAGAAPGARFPETVAPPALPGSQQSIPGVTGERSLPGIPA